MGDVSFKRLPTLRPASEAASPLSANWTLYKPEVLAEKLGLPLEVVDKALEETGFYKAVRIREEVIRLKTNLLKEQKELTKREQELAKELKQVRRELYYLQRELTHLRNILRLPREKREVRPDL